MLSTPEGCTNNSLITTNPYVYSKSRSTRKLLRQFTDTLDVKHNTSVQRFGTANSKRKAVKKRQYIVVTHLKLL